MALHRFLLELVHPTDVGDALVPGAVLTNVSTELGLRLTFDVAGRDIHVEVFPADDERAHAARSGALLFAYRSRGLSGPRFESIGRRLCEEVAARARRTEDGALATVLEKARTARRAMEGGQRIREVQVEGLLELAGTPAERYYTLSPYVGCLIGCKFCYAGERTSLVRRLEGLPAAPWGSYVDVRMNAAEVLRDELRALPPHPIKFCPIVSDPYQPTEARYAITRACLEAIAEVDPARTVLLLSRSTLLARDFDLMKSLSNLHVGASVPTIDDEVRTHFEPRGASIEARLGQLEEARAHGLHTFAVVQPLLPGDPAALASALARACASVSIDVLQGVYGANEEFAGAYAFAADRAWQVQQARALAGALGELGVPLWRGELPTLRTGPVS